MTVDNDVHTDLAPRLSRALPQPILDLSHERLIALLADKAERPNLRRAVETDELPGAGYTGLVKHGRFDRIVILHAPTQPELRGQTVAAHRRGARRRRLRHLPRPHRRGGRPDRRASSTTSTRPRSGASSRIPWSWSAPTASSCRPVEELDDPGLYWPCSYGEYPGILERYVRDEPFLRLEEAIRKMTSFPAQRFGLSDRGVLRPGLAADVLVFDLERLRDRATNLYPHSFPFENIPHGYAEGMDFVLVNGAVVVDDGGTRAPLPGRVLRHGRG